MNVFYIYFSAVEMLHDSVLYKCTIDINIYVVTHLGTTNLA